MPDKPTHAEVREVQKALNAFTEKRLRGVAPLIVDGDKGAATDHRIRICKWYLGLKAPTGSAIGGKLLIRLKEPRHAEHFPDRRYVARGLRRRAAQRARWRALNLFAYVAPGVVRYEGKPVAKVAIPYLVFAKKHDWPGTVTSGWRDPLYSRSLCMAMCGAPSCPGRCAGLSSNHVGISKDRFAIDVTAYVKFGQVMARDDAPTPRIFNALGAQDPVHFSPTGR